MAYQVLSRKWRPKHFQDVVGQKHVTRSLQNAILKDRLGHAYLLTGTRGIGKTSVARIFAKSLRCENRLEDANPCGECKGCKEFEGGSSMNVFEIDGASNNSVDDVRELVNNVQTLPTFGRYKIYIIDEVHMLTTHAFNALLKTLEEPPKHVIFLLATTEPHKLLDTVLSRCQRFDFRNATVDSLVVHIQEIAKKESIEFENEKIVRILASQGKGSFRDTLSLMDQVLSFSEDGHIDEQTMSTALGLAKVSSIRNLFEAILIGDTGSVSQSYKEMLYENVSVENITGTLLDFTYDVIQDIDHIDRVELGTKGKEYLQKATVDELFWLYESMVRDLTWATASVSPEKVVEIVFLKHTRRGEILQGTGIAVSEVGKKKDSPIEEPLPVRTESEPPLESQEPQERQEPQEEPEATDQKVDFSDVATSLESNQPEAEGAQQAEEQSEPSEQRETLEEYVVTDSNPTWKTFDTLLKEKLPAIYAELEQGNIIEDLTLNEGKAYVKYGFSGEAKLFYEHLVNGEGREKIQGLMKSYFKVDEAELDLAYLDEEEVEASGFSSKSELREKERIKTLEERERRLREHPIIQEAEKLFGKKVDRIKVKEES